MNEKNKITVIEARMRTPEEQDAINKSSEGAVYFKTYEEFFAASIRWAKMKGCVHNLLRRKRRPYRDADDRRFSH